MEKAITKSIKKTLTYFDLANFSLTKEELFAYLWLPPEMSYEHFLAELEAINSSVFFSSSLLSQNSATDICKREKFGFFFFPGHEATIENRRCCLSISELKMKIASRAIGKIRSVPFLKAVFVCNSVGAEQARDDSDIDFFIVGTPKRIWITRFFTNLILRLWGMRTYGAKTKNKICLSFFVDSEHLNLAELRVVDDDIHFAYWLHQMAPLYDPDNWYNKFLQLNDWTDQFLPNIKNFVRGEYVRRAEKPKVRKIWKIFWETILRGSRGDWIESQVKRLQIAKMKVGVKEKARQKDGSVVLGDGIIKLHENDLRKEYREKWLVACRLHGCFNQD